MWDNQEFKLCAIKSALYSYPCGIVEDDERRFWLSRPRIAQLLWFIDIVNARWSTPTVCPSLMKFIKRSEWVCDLNENGHYRKSQKSKRRTSLLDPAPFRLVRVAMPLVPVQYSISLIMHHSTVLVGSECLGRLVGSGEATRPLYILSADRLEINAFIDLSVRLRSLEKSVLGNMSFRLCAF